MSLKGCIDDLKKAGALTAEQAAHAHKLFDEIKATRRKAMGEAAADAAATKDTLAALDYQAQRRRIVTLKQIDAQRRIIADTASYNRGKGQQEPGAAALALLDQDGKASYMNIAAQKQAIIARAHATMERLLATFSRNLVGEMRGKAQMANVVRELMGESTGDLAAKEMAEAWTATAEELRQRFNAAGGAIGKLAGGWLPQSHDGVSIRESGYKPWRDFIAPLLDRAKMKDAATNAPFTDDAFEAMLGHVYETITTDGWNTREPGSGGGRRLANTRAEHRFLHFADADGWMAYQERFGGGTTTFDAMTAHIDAMATDIAIMERLGTNPMATIRMVQDGIKKDAALKGRRDTLLSSAFGEAEQVGKLYDLLSGKSAVPVNAARARGLAALRSWQVASKLGGALWSAVSDTGFSAVTRGFNGLPIVGAINDHFRLMASAEDRAGAIRLGLIAEHAAQHAGAMNRYTGESIGPGVASRLADGVLRASGLSAWTQSGKWAYGMGELARATEFADRGFGDLPEAYRGHLERYGIDGRGWDGIRASQRLNVRGADFINPTAIEDRALGDRMLRMILSETAYAVPEVTARARAMMSFGQPGSIGGMVASSMFQFKSFGVSMILTHGRRAMALQPYNRAMYAAGLFVTTTLLGAVAMQAKEVIKGRTPRPMDDPTFWAQAVAQGSGFGIFGDLMQSQVIQQLAKGSGTARASGSLGEMLIGPVGAMAADALDLGIAEPAKDIRDWWLDDPYKAHTGKAAMRALKSYLPGVNLWYMRVPFERLVLDNLQTLVDPHAAQSRQMMERHAAEQGQDYWWHPGEMTPDFNREPPSAS